jgi:hypothetical protein
MRLGRVRGWLRSLIAVRSSSCSFGFCCQGATKSTSEATTLGGLVANAVLDPDGQQTRRGVCGSPVRRRAIPVSSCCCCCCAPLPLFLLTVVTCQMDPRMLTPEQQVQACVFPDGLALRVQGRAGYRPDSMRNYRVLDKDDADFPIVQQMIFEGILLCVSGVVSRTYVLLQRGSDGTFTRLMSRDDGRQRCGRCYRSAIGVQTRSVRCARGARVVGIFESLSFGPLSKCPECFAV